MKRRITLSLELFVSIVLASMMTSDSTTNAAPPQRFRADTGVVSINQNQLLRLTVSASEDVESITFVYNKLDYMSPGPCEDGVCQHMVASRMTSDPHTVVTPNGAVMDIVPAPGSSAVRGILISNTRNVKVNASIIDRVTGETQVLVALLIP